MFARLFSSSPKRPPPPDPTPKWKDEVQSLESNTALLKNIFPTQQASAVGSASPTGAGSPNAASSPRLSSLDSSSPSKDSNNNNNNSSSQQKFDSVPKLLFMLENDSGEGFARRVKPLAFAVAKQYEELKRAITDEVAPKYEQNAKNLKEQIETIAVAFSDSHELKFVREDLEGAQKKNASLENEVDTARQTVVELMSKISKLNPKAAKELKEQQQQQKSSPSSPNRGDASSPSPRRVEVETASCECQASFQNLIELYLMKNDGEQQVQKLKELTPDEELRQKLMDTEYLLSEAQTALEEAQKKQHQQTSSSNSRLNRSESEVHRWKALVEEERKSLETLRQSHSESETQLRARYENEIAALKKQHQEDLIEKRMQWEQQTAETNRRALLQKEETARGRMIVDEGDERAMFLTAEYVTLHVGDARAKLVVAKKEAEDAIQQKNEYEIQAKELQSAKDKLAQELTENTRAMMLLQAGTGNDAAGAAKSPSKSRFSLS